MALNVAKELAALRRMTPSQLREKYAEVFGEESRSGHKEWLVKRIIWRMQANVEGDLSERARQRATELANDADLRMKAPPQKKTLAMPAARRVTGKIATTPNQQLPMPGTVLTREYKGRTLNVTVLADGFEYEGEVYASLSGLAKKITGSHTSGYLFFGLAGKGGR